MTYTLKSIGLVIVYVFAAKVGLTFATTDAGVTMLWPSGGIALAAVLVGGKRYLPAVFAGAFLTGIMVKAPPLFLLGATLGNVLETYLGYVLFKRFGHPKQLELKSAFDLFIIIGLGALVPTLASALLGPVTLLVSGLIHADKLVTVMWNWWRSDVLGIAFFTPLILSFVRYRLFVSNMARFWELLVLWALAIAVGQMVFLAQVPVTLFDEPLGLVWIFPFIIWAGLRTGRRNTALIQLFFLGQALTSAYLKMGVFATEFAVYGLSNFWMFGMLLALPGMALAILSTTQRHAAKKVAQNAWVFEVSHDGVIITDHSNNIVSVNAAFSHITGYTMDEVLGKNPRILSSGRHEPAFFAEMWNTLNATSYWSGEIWNRRKDGSVYLVQIAIHAITNARAHVTSRLAIFSDITEERAAQDAITHQAQHDFLTGLPNRLLFCDRFNQQLALAKRHGIKFALISMDLDDFKPVNDRLGHAVGDDLLIAVARRLSALVREIDTVSRFGGDEFAILVSEVESIDDVISLANKILVRLSEPFSLNQHMIQVTVSLGVALYPDHGIAMSVIARKADDAMYEAKRKGHNQYAVASIH